jgi:hypothetical protein
MKTATRSYSVGFELVEVGVDFIKIRNYSVVDGIKTTENKLFTLLVGDMMRYDYTKSIRFDDWIDVGDNKVVQSKEI